ncbi:hypothetical protein GCM10008957_51750 [Deinococcus ruber]|uniref:Uncharacterized protein n=1 Tax=Deinococcus ruber TaxID=1848197 RepID=A0A918KVL1_9DEIO|nr:hypothetical protein GCM10008957_51750 [Deinococcus ruber]
MKAEFDTFDLLFVNARFSLPTLFERVTDAIYDEMFNLNARGPFVAVQKLTPLINRGGAVVLTTSVSNVKGMLAKPALRNFAQVLAVEFLPQEIRVNAVSPGPIDTGIREGVHTQHHPDEALRNLEGNIKAALFLAFDATFTTGLEISVDGSWSQL